MFKFLIFYLGFSFALLIKSEGFCEKLSKGWHFLRSDVDALHKRSPDYNISYGDHPLQFAELRLPHGSGPHPIAIIVHGGCWVGGSASVNTMGSLADALRDLGIATWNIEYRREQEMGGGWPGTFNDVALAADFLRKIAAQYALDLKKVIAVGHSAGGHLALWLAARHRLSPKNELYMKEPLPLQGVVALGGVPDLKAFRTHAKNVCRTDAIGKLLGSASNQVEKHYKEASPKELLPLHTPQILIYGSDDEIVPATFGHAYTKEAQQKGDSIELIEVKGAAHQEFKVPNSITWPALKAAVFSLLKRDK